LWVTPSLIYVANTRLLTADLVHLVSLVISLAGRTFLACLW